MDTILGTKVDMSQTYVDGVRVAVTTVDVASCIVTHIKTKDKDGYWAVQLGMGEKKLKNITKPMQGHLKGALAKDSKMGPKYLREIRFTEEPNFKVGDILKVSDILNSGDKISVAGISKGKGFAGGVKRWGFHGGSKTHGQSDRWRAPGSIGQGTTPGRVYKGKHMAGRMGSDQIKVKGLKIISVNPDKNQIEIGGPVPGTKGTLLMITKYA